MIYEKIMTINQVSWVLECIVSINYFCINNQYPCPWWKIIIKPKNMINENKRKRWTNRKFAKRSILMNVQNIFLMRPLMKKIKKPKYVKKLILMDIQNNMFGNKPIYLRDIIFLAWIPRALLSNKNGILYFWKKSTIQHPQGCNGSPSRIKTSYVRLEVLEYYQQYNQY